MSEISPHRLRAPTAAAVLLLLVFGCGHANEYSADGDVIAIDPGGPSITIRHDDIPGLMPAMTMRFPASAPAALAGARVGGRVRFDLVRRGSALVLTRLVPIGTAGPGRPGIHDHTPHHGGVVAMVGMLHLEAAATADGRIRVYLTDVWRRPLPLDEVSGTVTLGPREGRRELALEARDGVLEARGPSIAGPDLYAHVRLVRAGEPVEMRFVLPLGAAASGAAEVPLEGCVPPPDEGAPGRRPRCTLAFSRAVTAAAALPDGSAAVISVVNGGIGLWSAPGGEFRLGLAAAPAISASPEAAPHPEAANAVAVSPDGRETVVALENRLVVHATASGEVLRELPALRGVVRAVAWSPDARRLLVSVFYDATAHLIAADDGRELGRLPIEREGAGVAFSPDGGVMAVGSELGPIALFMRPGDPPIRSLVDGPRAAEALLFATGDRLLSAGGDGVVRVWDASTGAVVARGETGTALQRIVLAPGGRLAATGGLDGVVRLHDVATGAVVETIRWHAAAIWGLAWAGPTLVSGDGAGRVAFWDTSDLLAAPGP